MANSAATKLRHNAQRKALTEASKILGSAMIPAQYRTLATNFETFRTDYAANGMQWLGTPATATATTPAKATGAPPKRPAARGKTRAAA